MEALHITSDFRYKVTLNYLDSDKFYSIDFAMFNKVIAGIFWFFIEILGNGLLIILAYWHLDDPYKTLVHSLQIHTLAGFFIHNVVSVTLATARYFQVLNFFCFPSFH